MASELRGLYRSKCPSGAANRRRGPRAVIHQGHTFTYANGCQATWPSPSCWGIGQKQRPARLTMAVPALGSDADGAPGGSPTSSTTSTAPTAASERSTGGSSAPPLAAGGSQPTQPQQQQQPRARATMEQMQREARAKLGDMVRQQLEADRQQQQYQQQQQQAPSQAGANLSGAVRSNGTGAPASSSSSSSAASPDTATFTSAAAAAATRPGGISGASDSTAGSSSPSVGRARELGGTAAAPAASAPPLAAPSPASEPTNLWVAMRAEWDEDLQRMKERWRQFVEHPLDPPPSQGQQQGRTPDASSSAEVGPSGRPEEDGGEGGGEIKRVAVVSRLVQLACVAAFVGQWAPVAQALSGGAAAAGAAAATAAGGGAAGREVWLALLVACPPTPLTLSWQADVVSLAAGQWGCLMTSSLLHSGLLSLGVSLASLDETLPWLESLDGFMVMAISYVMAGASASAAQLLLGSQAAGIAGLGAAVGLEAAVAVRCWRYTGGQLMPPSPACWLVVGMAVLMAFYQPLVGPWAILGGILGGVLSAVLAYDVLYGMRVVAGMSILLSMAAWRLVSWLPRAVWRLLVFLAAFVWATVVAVVQALRGV